ncbi:hypothetical protein WG915_04280 [Corynebacterium sp. H128]
MDFNALFDGIVGAVQGLLNLFTGGLQGVFNVATTLFDNTSSAISS